MICLKCRQQIQGAEKPLHGLHEKCFTQWFKLSGTSDFTDLYAKQTSSEPSGSNDEKFSRLNSSFFHGKYKKYSARLAGRNYILKVQQTEYPELPPTEYLSNQLASLLGLDVPSFFYILFQGTMHAFVSQNIIDLNQGGTLDHIYHFFKNDEDLACKDLIDVILRETGSLFEAVRFIELVLFDSLIGNHDRHGRNLAILMNSGKKKQLSPFYDNPSYLGIEAESLLEAQHEPRGAIRTRASKIPLMRDYVQEFTDLGYKDFVERFHKKVTSRSKKIFTIIEQSFISEKRKRAFMTLVERRLQELENAVT